MSGKIAIDLETEMKRRKKGLSFGKRRKRFDKVVFLEGFSWLVQIISVILIAYVCVAFFGIRTNVVGQAMAENLNNGDSVFMNRFVYIMSNPEAGDVVVFQPNGNEKSHYYIRRVVGVPGDTVQIKNGAVYINGELFNEKVTVSSIEDAGVASEEIKLENGEYFVLGDNRNNSEDSRYANIGNIKKEYIIGKAWFRFSSFKDMGFIH